MLTYLQCSVRCLSPPKVLKETKLLPFPVKTFAVLYGACKRTMYSPKGHCFQRVIKLGRSEYNIAVNLYRIAGNFRGVKYSLFSWASCPPRNFNVGVAYQNVGMQAGNETKRNFYSQKPPFLELNEIFTP